MRYLDAPILCVMLASILRPSRIPDTYQRNYEICKQTRCNCTDATAGRVFQYPPALAHRRNVLPHARNRSDLDQTTYLRRKHRGELAACSPRISRDFRRISLPRAAVENIARDEVSIDPNPTNYFDTRLTVFDHTLPIVT